MSKGVRLFIIVFGLIALGALGQAQEQTHGEQRQAEDEQEPTFTTMLRDIVIQYQAATDARRRREEEARQREIDDLIAQQGMNTATQAMQVATEEMRDYSLIQTWLIGIGTIFLFATLVLTLGANKATWLAVRVTREIGNKQLRAYVSYATIDVRGQADPQDFSVRIGYSFKVSFQNFGTTPARNAIVRTQRHIINVGEQVAAMGPSRTHATGFLGAEVGPGARQGGGFVSFTIAELIDAHANNKVPIISARIDYEDVFGRPHFHECCQGVMLIGDPALLFEPEFRVDALFQFGFYGPNNRSDQDKE